MGRTRRGTSWPAQFTVTLDDGSGNPPAALLSAASTAVDAVRPVGTSFTVRGPAVLPVTVQVALALTQPAQSVTVAPLVVAAIEAYVAALGIGVSLPVSRVVALSFGADPSVQAASVTLNGAAADAVPLPWGVVQIAGITAA